MKCRRCGADTTRRTHDGPKGKRTKWYAWYFVCPACRWMLMPPEAVRHVDGDAAAAVASDTAVAVASATQTDDYLHQDAGDDGRAPW